MLSMNGLVHEIDERVSSSSSSQYCAGWRLTLHIRVVDNARLMFCSVVIGAVHLHRWICKLIK